MEKSRELKMQEAEEIYNKYKKEVFDNYQIKSFEEMQVLTLPEHLAKRAPNDYGPNNSNYMNYQKDENLNEVYVFDSGKGEVYFFGTEKALIQGHIANENLKDGKITLSRELSERTAGAIFSNDPKKIKEFEENFFHGEGKDLEVLERILEKRGNFAKEINKTKNEIDPNAPDIEFNEKENQAIRKDNSKDNEGVSLEEEKKENQQIPEDVRKACQKLGVKTIKGFFYANANELSNKIDGTRVNKNGGKVLIIQVADSSRSTGPDRYYGMQDNNMVLYGNADQEMRDLTGKVTQMGKVLEPLKPEELQYFEYQDSDGLVIKEKIDENTELSMQEINNYKKKMEELLTKYSYNIYMIKESNMSPEQKIEQIQKIDDYCDMETTKIAQENDISMNNDRDIDTMTDIHTEEVQKQIEEDDGLDDRGKPLPPGH